ncbi:hypothetical protein QTG54_004879 [Skeletonema marinoi]|uniref:RRM domain-containing protein n=1 Tax=Skeletonema marinoi TaxID=267567 RepID=A0AAD8YFN7_9STRA|nr:hypothetical protein QTG54_004879 [Skeletonema marinoi]
MDETIGLGFHSHRNAITGVTSPTAAAPAASASINQQHATTKFVSSSADSKRMSMLFPPPPPHPSTAVQQPIIQLNDKRHPSLQIQQQLPLSTSSTQQPNDMHQNINFTNHPPTSSFQPPPGLPPPLSIPVAIAVPPLQFPPPPIPIQQQSSQMEQQQQHNDSIAKARAIAQRFHTQSNNQPLSYISSINNQHSNSVINNNNNDNTNVNNNNNNYAQKRQQHFQTEQLKLQTYTLKNLDYILKHDETQLRSHVECMNEMTEWGDRQGLQLQLIRQRQLEREQKREQQKQQRQQREVEQKSGGGIGSKDQRYLERIRKRRQLDTTAVANPQQQQQQQQQQRTSIYLTNLPTDGSINERTLRSLFCVYGQLDRVTMYRNRSTGELKGDGLIVFGVDDATINLGGNESGNNVQETTTNGTDLIETVCMQMNGAELPCGTVIGVEPADMDWGSRGKDEKFKQMDHCVQQQQQATASSGEGDVVMQSKEASMKDDEEEEDLDDFFASLE